ncbi:MAG: aldose epimerase family protein [Balneolaceae bacterium]|nr:aldose epimerase family protein [Balneolaceae bacterium]
MPLSIRLLTTALLLAALAGCGLKGGEESSPETATSSPQAMFELDPGAFESNIDGRQTGVWFLGREEGIRVAVTNYGGRIAGLLVPDPSGDYANVVLGFNSLEGFREASEPYFGALIGRYANRIDGGRFTLNGTTYELARNNGSNHLHGGPGGFHTVVWEVTASSDTSLSLRHVSEDGEEGYPGRLTVEVDYRLTSARELRIDYRAETDARTVLNLTSHGFFNLGGAATGTINDHLLAVNADRYAPIHSTLIPTGELAPVEGTPFDFRRPTPIGQRVGADHPQLAHGSGYDHNFVLREAGAAPAFSISGEVPTSGWEEAPMRLAARAEDPSSGRTMTVFTTEPGLQFYGGNFLDGSDTGREGEPYGHRTAFCLEPQHFPDSPNRPEFPSTVLEAGEVYRSATVFRF